ncbi:MAG: LysR family transcriptional regulator [Pseudomonadota bacterium]
MNQESSTIVADTSGPWNNRVFNLEAVRSFVAIYETGTFKRAATRVNLSPSAVSLHIAKLEDQIGARLMTRNARHIALTERGEAMLRFARQLLGTNAEAMAFFHGSPLKGHLRLVAPHDLGVSLVPDLLCKLSATHPGIVVDVGLDVSQAVLDAFACGQANIAFFNDTKNPIVEAKELKSEPLAWLMREGGRAIEHRPLPLAIAEIRCAWREAALQTLDAAGTRYRVAYSSDTSAGQIAALRADLAIAVLPASLAQNGLVQVPDEYGLPRLPTTKVFMAHDGSELVRTLASKVV